MRWPENKEFAFTIFDDTDGAVLEEVSLVYRFLTELDFRTTKSVWVLRATGAAFHPDATCEDSDYLAWLKQIKAAGFELGLHNVSAGSSTRDSIEKGLDLFCHYFGHPPCVYVNHSGALENIYWGLKRFSDPLVRSIHRALTTGKMLKRIEDVLMKEEPGIVLVYGTPTRHSRGLWQRQAILTHDTSATGPPRSRNTKR